MERRKGALELRHCSGSGNAPKECGARFVYDCLIPFVAFATFCSASSLLNQRLMSSKEVAGKRSKSTSHWADFLWEREGDIL